MPVRHRLPALAVVALVVGACASPAATTTPTVAPSPTVEATDEPTASAEPTAAARPTGRAEETTEATEQPSAAADELDMSLASNFGSEDLTAGFTPDPFSDEVVSGGPIDVSYLGDDCRGYATQASDYDIEYTAGGQDLLRFYFVADEAEDTTLIINAPDGSWHCNDDAPFTIDPMIDFTDPQSGRYDIWIGSFESGAQIPGTLFVTELESNSP